MAKDREGSVNIYGAMQAKTAQGIVAYTDGIAHENEDGTVINLDVMLKNGVGGGSAIVDVDELVYPGWSGTAVPNSGYVENVYFNTELSVDEVLSIIESANIELFGGMAYFPLMIEGQEEMIQLMYMNGMAMIITSAGRVFSSSEETGAGFVGWNSEFNGVISYNANALPTYEEDGETFEIVGVSNDKLSSLFSTTPFVYAEEPKDDVFYRVKDTSNVVPSSGYIQKIYRNPNITVDEMNNIFDSLEYTEVNGMDSVLISANQEMSNFFVVAIYSGSYILSLNNTTLFFNGEWLVEDLSFEIGYNNYASEFANQMGAKIQNDKLANIFSVTNKFGIEEKIYSYKEGEYKLVLQEGDFKQEGIEYIEITADSIDNITITQDIYDSINSKDNAVVKLIVDDDSGIKTTLLLYKSNVLMAESTNTGSIVLFSFSSMEGLQLPLNSVTFLIINSDLTHIYKTIDIANPFTIEGFAIRNNLLIISVTKSTGSNYEYSVSIDTAPTSSSKNLISSGAVYTALQSYAKTTEVNQMIADYITTNFENGDEGSY